MFGLFYGLYKWATTKAEYSVLIIGLDGAGKTVLILILLSCSFISFEIFNLFILFVFFLFLI